jgi:hypothetical protein
MTSRHGPGRKHRFEQFLYCCASTRRGNLLVSWSLPSNASTRYNTFKCSSSVADELVSFMLLQLDHHVNSSTVTTA